MATIECSKCAELKDESQFHRFAAHRTGRRPDCKACRYLVAKAQRARDPDGHRRDVLAWRAANPEKARAILQRYNERHREKRREQSREWQQNNRAADAERSARQRALEKRATPAWASRAYIALFYDMAKLEEARTGRPVQVDHIIPLRSKFVCGLHVEDNLQLLFSVDNLKKGNRLEGEPSSLR